MDVVEDDAAVPHPVEQPLLAAPAAQLSQQGVAGLVAALDLWCG